MEYLISGKITSTFGIKGEVKVYFTSTFHNLRFKKNKTIFIKNNDEYIPLVIERAYQKDDKFYIIKFKDYNTIEQSETLKNKELFVIKSKDILKKNEFFYLDLIGLKVKDESLNEKGKVIKVNDFGPQISLEISFNNKTYNVPFNDFFIKEIDLENKEIIIHFIEGLI